MEYLIAAPTGKSVWKSDKRSHINTWKARPIIGPAVPMLYIMYNIKLVQIVEFYYLT
jgi:hypothetical protein